MSFAQGNGRRDPSSLIWGRLPSSSFWVPGLASQRYSGISQPVGPHRAWSSGNLTSFWTIPWSPLSHAPWERSLLWIPWACPQNLLVPPLSPRGPCRALRDQPGPSSRRCAMDDRLSSSASATLSTCMGGVSSAAAPPRAPLSDEAQAAEQPEASSTLSPSAKRRKTEE